LAWLEQMIERETEARDGGRAPIPSNPPGRPRGRRRRFEQVNEDLDRLLGAKNESPDAGDERPLTGRRRSLTRV
jgi:hypothetical protein